LAPLTHCYYRIDYGDSAEGKVQKLYDFVYTTQISVGETKSTNIDFSNKFLASSSDPD